MSDLTKRALEQSLKNLLLQKPLHKITISDIADDCGINRMTFYYHFKDIYDLVEWSCQEDAAKALAGKKTYETWQQGFEQIFEAVLANKPFIMNVYHSVSREQVENYLYKLTYDLLEGVVEEQAAGMSVRPEDKAFIANVYKYAFVGLMLDWIKHDMKGDPKEIIDRLDRVYMTARTNMIGDGETTLTFDVDISAGLSHQSVAESGVTVSETYSDTNMGMVSIDHRTKRYTPDCLPVYTRSDTPYIPLDERITYEDGIPCYRYRRNITNCPLASYCLVPQELAFSVLSDTGSWEISDEPVIHPDTGRSCVVITGVPSDYFAAKHGIDSFSMSVDEETGVILIFEGKKEDGVVIYTYVAEFDTAQETPVGRSDAASFADYEQEVIWYNKS